MSVKAVAAVLLAAALFGTTGTAQALGPDSTTPLGVGAARLAVGGPVLLAAARGPHRRHTAGAVLRRIGAPRPKDHRAVCRYRGTTSFSSVTS